MADCIQGLWIGRELSLMEQLSIKSFLKHGHTYHIYLYENVRNVPEGAVIKNAKEILPANMIFKYRWGPGRGSYAIFSDLFRYKLLLDRGGVWADLDIVCLKPFQFSSEYVFMSDTGPNNQPRVAGGIIKAPPGSECIKACYEEGRRMDLKHMNWTGTGPDLLASNVQRFRLDAFVVPPRVFAPIPYWEYKMFVKPCFRFTLPDETYAVHLWNELWRRRARRKGIIKRTFQRHTFDKDVLYSPETLYGRLQRMYL